MDSKTNAVNEVNSYFNGPRIILVALQIPYALGIAFENIKAIIIMKSSCVTWSYGMIHTDTVSGKHKGKSSTESVIPEYFGLLVDIFNAPSYSF